MKYLVLNVQKEIIDVVTDESIAINLCQGNDCTYVAMNDKEYVCTNPDC